MPCVAYMHHFTQISLVLLKIQTYFFLIEEVMKALLEKKKRCLKSN